MNVKDQLLKGKIIDLRKSKDNTGREKEKKNDILPETHEIEFSNKPNLKNFLRFDFGNDLRGLNTNVEIYTNQNLDLNFENILKHNQTQLIYLSQNFRIGSQQPDFAFIPVYPVINSYVDAKPLVQILGITIIYKSENLPEAIFHPTLKIDKDGKVPLITSNK